MPRPTSLIALTVTRQSRSVRTGQGELTIGRTSSVPSTASFASTGPLPPAAHPSDGARGSRLACRPRSQVVGSPSANRHQFGRDGVRVEADAIRIGQRLVGKRQRRWPICVPPKPVSRNTRQGSVTPCVHPSNTTCHLLRFA